MEILSVWQVATEKDFLDAVNKVIKQYAKFSSTPRYMTYNWTVIVTNNLLCNNNIIINSYACNGIALH